MFLNPMQDSVLPNPNNPSSKAILSPKDLSCSVFSGYLKWTTLSLLAATLISTVIFVFVDATYVTTQTLTEYSPLSQYFLKTTLLSLFSNIQKCDKLTPGYWCDIPVESIDYFLFLPSKGKFTDASIVNKLIANHTTQQQICYHLSTFTVRVGSTDYSAPDIRKITQVLDGLIVLVLLVMLMVNEYRAEQKQAGKKRTMIEKFSIRIGNLPAMGKFELLVKLKEYIEKEVEECHKDCKAPQNLIFDIQTNLKDRGVAGQSQLPGSIQEDEDEDLDNDQFEVWVTLSSYETKRFLLQIFRHNVWYFRLAACFSSRLAPKLFEGNTIEVDKAPNPDDIKYNNISVRSCSRLKVRVFIYLISLCLFVSTTLLLLFIKNLESTLVTSVAVVATNIVAPMVLVWLSKYERYVLRTHETTSNINKIAVYKYVNSGLVVFLSQFNVAGVAGYFASYFNYFTNSEFDSVTNEQWILKVGLSIVYTMALSIITSNVAMMAGSLGLNWLKKCWAQRSANHNHNHNPKSIKTQPQLKLSTVTAESLYGEVASLMMIILTYSYLLPILYPLGLLILGIKYLCFRLVRKDTSFPCDSFNGLTRTASSLTLLAIVIHMLVIGLIEESNIHLAISCVIGVGYLFRVFLMKVLLGMIRRVKGKSLLSKGQGRIVESGVFVGLLSTSQKKIKLSEIAKRVQEIDRILLSTPKERRESQRSFELKWREFLFKKAESINWSIHSDNQLIGKPSYTF